MTHSGIVRYGTAADRGGGMRQPFAKAARAGEFVFVSGQVPTAGGETVSGGIVPQAEAAIGNLATALALAGCGLDDVVKVNVWLSDPRDFASFNEVFEKHFGDHQPARSTVQSALMVDSKIEMDAIAYRPMPTGT